MIRGMGSSESIPTSRSFCCDICTAGKLPYSHLGFLKPLKAKCKQRPVQVRSVSSTLSTEVRKRLMTERLSIVNGKVGFRTLGINMVCPVSCVDDVCSKLNFIWSVDDLRSIPGLRPVFADAFYTIIMETMHQFDLIRCIPCT